MASLISLGSINADFQVRAGSVPEGPGSILAEELMRTSGGKAANVAVLAKRLGAEALLLCCVGDDDLASQALAGPQREGIDTSRVRERAGPTGYSSIVVPPDGSKSIVLCTNANDAWDDDADGVRQDVDAAPDGSVLVVDLEVPAQLVQAALEGARARGFVIVLDPAPADRLDESWLSMVDHLTPDHTEAQRLTGIDTASTDGARRAAEDLHHRGAGAAYVKLESGGCAIASDEGTQVVESPSDVEAVDGTGAGDAFAGALGWALLQRRPPLEAAHVAVAASTCAVTRFGSQESYPDMTELRSMIERVELATMRST